MKKLIAKTRIGSEFLHSKKDAFFCDRNAQKIADSLNKNQYNLAEGETWHIYDEDYMQSFYVSKKICIKSNGSIVTKLI